MNSQFFIKNKKHWSFRTGVQGMKRVVYIFLFVVNIQGPSLFFILIVTHYQLGNYSIKHILSVGGGEGEGALIKEWALNRINTSIENTS